MAKITVPPRWTIVQHSAFGYKGNLGFEKGLETRQVKTQAEQITVVKAGGLLFETYDKAEAYSEEEPYKGQTVVHALLPYAQGTFSEHKIDGLRIYLPPS